MEIRHKVQMSKEMAESMTPLHRGCKSGGSLWWGSGGGFSPSLPSVATLLLRRRKALVSDGQLSGAEALVYGAEVWNTGSRVMGCFHCHRPAEKRWDQVGCGLGGGLVNQARAVSMLLPMWLG
jgi:hypothetical protein